jgi:hypothetical protein
MRGWWGMTCFNGLSAEQQEFLVVEGYLPFGYEPEGECSNGAEIGIECMDDRTPGPRFYCRACAVDYLNVCICGKPMRIRGHWSMDEMTRIPIRSCPVHRFTEPMYLDDDTDSEVSTDV